MEGIDKIPQLLEDLVKNAESTTRKLKERTKTVYDLVAAISTSTEDRRTPALNDSMSKLAARVAESRKQGGK